MPTVPPALEALRREIDEIDDAVHDLILRRVEIVGAIARVKADAAQPMLRPAREAQLLRRLVGRHRGPMPVGVIMRLWRELITGGSLGLQAAFSVAVLDVGAGRQAWNLARDHYGGSVPIHCEKRAADLIAAVAAERATVGVLPAPSDGEAEPWWIDLASEPASPVNVVVKLPFAGGTGAGSALVVARMASEQSGDDRTLLALASRDAAAEPGIAEALERRGLKASRLARACDRKGTPWQLFELVGFLAPEDGRVALIRRESQIGEARLIGGYATPLSSH